MKSDYIKAYALQDKRHYTTELTLPNGCFKVDDKITVKVNPSHKIHEYDLSDNAQTVVWGSKYPADYCATTSNPVLTWDQKYLDLLILENGYATNVDQLLDRDWVKVRDYEKLAITKIEMRSKLMTDKKLGPNGDGWVNVIEVDSSGNITQVATPEIKAGYGFDIRVTVEYETDAYYNERTDSRLVQIPSSRLYTPLRSLNLADNLFIQLPGTGKNLISLTTDELKLERTETIDTSNNVTKHIWTYTIADRLSPNGTNEMVNSLFIDENTKDGEYEISLYTFPIYGVPDKTPIREGNSDVLTEHKPLCSNTTIKFKVNGSVYDDLNIGVIH